MKLQPPENSNYAATVVTIRQIIPLENCDNVVATPLLGYQAIVGKDTKVGDIGIVFTAETQLSEEYARLNNLHRHGNLNDDESAKGYLEDNRRVKALKFRGHRSDALFMPLSSLEYISYRDCPTHLNEGDTFDKLGDHEICRKYVKPSQGYGPKALQAPKPTRIDKIFLPEHFDTDNYFRNSYKLSPGDRVTITQKLHGTSIRVGHTLVKRKLSWVERLAQKFGVKVQDTEYDYVFGSRKVIKDPNNPEQNHFYSEDIWTREGKKLEGLLPKGFIVYGELIGWVGPGQPIQHGYTYNIPEGRCELYVYRVSYINPEGRQTDLSWDQVKEFCTSIGLKYVPDLDDGKHSEFVELGIEQWLDKRYNLLLPQAVPVDKGKVDEGVCIRREGLTPLVLKAKSPVFLQHETKMLDKEVEDLEEDGQAT